MARVLYLDAAQKRACVDNIKRWRRIGRSTAPTDFAAASNAALQLYDLIGVDRPTVVLQVGSPTYAVLAGLFAHNLLSGNDVYGSRLPMHIEKYVRNACGQTRRILPGKWRNLSSVFAQRCRDIASQTYSKVASCMAENALVDFDNLDTRDTAEDIDTLELADLDSIKSFLAETLRTQVFEVLNGPAMPAFATVYRQEVLDATDCLVTKFPNFGFDDLALLTSVRDILLVGKLAAPASLAVFETLAKSCGGVWLHENVLVICDRPSTLKFNEAGNLHCVDGPSIAYPDGYALYHLKGVRVPAWLVLQPEQLSTKHIDEEQNTEVRRIMMEMFGGVAKYVKTGGGRVVATLPADYPYKGLRTARLIVKRFAGDAEPIVYVDLLNSTPEPDGTTKRYLLRVEPWAYAGEVMRNPHAAAASTWRYADLSLAYPRWEDYAPVAES